MTPPNASRELPLVRDPVEELAEVFLERYRRGERPSLSEFIARAPEHGDEIRELFPALILMEQAGSLRLSRSRVLQLASSNATPAIIDSFGRSWPRRHGHRLHEAEQEALGRHVALKILPVSATTGARSLVRFRREARSAARLHHTNIVPVFDIGEREGIHYYAMQFIQGRGLDEVIAELRRLRQLPDSPLTPPTSETSPCQASCLAEGLQSGRFQGEELVAEGTTPTGPTAAPVSSHDEPRVEVLANSRPSSADSSGLLEQNGVRVLSKRSPRRAASGRGARLCSRAARVASGYQAEQLAAGCGGLRVGHRLWVGQGGRRRLDAYWRRCRYLAVYGSRTAERHLGSAKRYLRIRSNPLRASDAAARVSPIRSRQSHQSHRTLRTRCHASAKFRSTRSSRSRNDHLQGDVAKEPARRYASAPQTWRKICVAS